MDTPGKSAAQAMGGMTSAWVHVYRLCVRLSYLGGKLCEMRMEEMLGRERWFTKHVWPPITARVLGSSKPMDMCELDDLIRIGAWLVAVIEQTTTRLDHSAWYPEGWQESARVMKR